MGVYISGTLISMILSYIYVKNITCFRKKIKVITLSRKEKILTIDIFKFLPMIPLIIIAGIRYNVGQDYLYTYVNIFNKVLNGNESNAWGEIGYIYLNKLVIFFTDDFVWIFVLTACIFIFMVYISIYRESDSIPYSIFLLVTMGYYFCFLNGIRQMLAASVLLYSIPFIRERKLFKFSCVTCVAALFHNSALLFYPIYFLYNIKCNYIVMLGITTLVYVFSDSISEIIIYFVNSTKYAWYLDSAYKAERKGYIMIAINILIFVFAIIFNKDKKNDIYIKIQWVAVLTMAFIGKIPVAHRLQWGFGLPGIILIPNIINGIKSEQQKRILQIFIMITYTIYAFYTVGIKNSNAVLPYQTIFSIR